MGPVCWTKSLMYLAATSKFDTGLSQTLGQVRIRVARVMHIKNPLDRRNLCADKRRMFNRSRLIVITGNIRPTILTALTRPVVIACTSRFLAEGALRKRIWVSTASTEAERKTEYLEL